MADTWYTIRDREYIRAHFVRLEDLRLQHAQDVAAVRAAIARGVLPRPTYHVDGEEWVPPDYFALMPAPNETPDESRARFMARYDAAYRATYGRPVPSGEAAKAWEDYLSGDYGVCLRQVTPETIVQKGYLIDTIRTLVAAPAPDRAAWRDALKVAVDALDALERPFATGDRERFGGLSSRDLFVTAVRTLFPMMADPHEATPEAHGGA
jgi:hypothetical protein